MFSFLSKISNQGTIFFGCRPTLKSAFCFFDTLFTLWSSFSCWVSWLKHFSTIKLKKKFIFHIMKMMKMMKLMTKKSFFYSEVSLTLNYLIIIIEVNKLLRRWKFFFENFPLRMNEKLCLFNFLFSSLSAVVILFCSNWVHICRAHDDDDLEFFKPRDDCLFSVKCSLLMKSHFKTDV